VKSEPSEIQDKYKKQGRMDVSQNKENQKFSQIKIGKYEIFFRKNVGILDTVNNLMIALWFLLGSILFFFESMEIVRICLYIVGSVQLLVRPTIKLIQDISIRKQDKKEYDNS
jgi:hypothetical protein